MIKETNLSDGYLKAISGKFDVDIIFSLNLKDKSINKLNSVIKCKNLVFLNLSNNKISNISGIDGLKELVYLNMSFNQLWSIDGIEFLIKLKHLKLAGNKIDNSKNFIKFKSLTNLTKLYFQEVSHNDATANPICKIQDYRNEMFKIFVNLKALDGVKKDGEPLCNKLGNLDKDDLKLNIDDFSFNFKDSKSIY
jgi:hypothetical protein